MIGTPKKCIKWLTDEPEEKTYVVKEYKARRSKAQNDYYWTLVEELARYLHTGKIELHNQLLRRYGVLQTYGGKAARLPLPDTDEVEKQVLQGETLHMRPTSQVQVGSDGVVYRTYVMLKGSSDMDTTEMSALLDGCISECKEAGIETLPPQVLAEMRAYGRKKQR